MAVSLSAPLSHQPASVATLELQRPTTILGGEQNVSDANDDLNITNPEHAEHHIVTPMNYLFVYIALIIGTILTVVAADIDMGVFNPIIALGIACTKACVVILFFMHVKYQSRLVKLTVSAGFFTFLVLITMTLTDYMSRAWGLW
jgi:cytochrome c oxidase subunit 4